ncbi:hypothetical protein KOR34_07770 [Posidoniimonas corsicana]|uniref:Uncharacterized protein n=1 Tax=Posidoniimonas corsicana TaxID=1938618 RepID=A0A5C5VC88_9BACT|nr:hypothetical protein KOR34_07770 [Posidoniimonas corsicana]
MSDNSEELEERALIADSDLAVAMGHLSRFISIMANGGGATGGTTWPAAMGIRHCCEYLDIGRTKFGEIVKAGELPKPFQLGGRPHWLREDLDRYVRKLARRRD